MEHPKAIGDRATLAIIAALNAAGYGVLVPFGENARYDVAIDDGSRLWRVQCKTGHLHEGAVRFRTCSSYAHHPNPRMLFRDYQGDVDAFAVHCVESGAVYLIPIEHLPNKYQASLRVEPSRNNQRRKIRPASAYEIASAKIVVTAGLAAKPGGSAPSA